MLPQRGPRAACALRSPALQDPHRVLRRRPPGLGPDCRGLPARRGGVEGPAPGRGLRPGRRRPHLPPALLRPLRRGPPRARAGGHGGGGGRALAGGRLVRQQRYRLLRPLLGKPEEAGPRQGAHHGAVPGGHRGRLQAGMARLGQVRREQLPRPLEEVRRDLVGTWRAPGHGRSSVHGQRSQPGDHRPVGAKGGQRVLCVLLSGERRQAHSPLEPDVGAWLEEELRFQGVHKVRDRDRKRRL
mmetsp:Transcript_113756/g.332229  ORF Transcript_113756/g.332229 Transcript_113756/m.332229 type:complete len:242 (-) Transcript_113756:465-1190(-)